MNWHYDNPIKDGEYLCCVKECSRPTTLAWHEEKGGWGEWWQIEDNNGVRCKWYSFYNNDVVCYIGFDEIPMPENW